MSSHHTLQPKRPDLQDQHTPVLTTETGAPFATPAAFPEPVTPAAPDVPACEDRAPIPQSQHSPGFTQIRSFDDPGEALASATAYEHTPALPILPDILPATPLIPALRTLQTAQPAPFVLQAALRVSAPNDPYEAEADQIARQIMGMHGAALPDTDATTSAPATPTLQLQRSSDAAGLAVPPALVRHVEQLQGSGDPLPDAERAFFEPRMGHDFSQVRVRTDPATARELSARAFTTGSDIVFDQGEYQPGTSGGRQLLAHELAHVVQQRGGDGTVSRSSKGVIQRLVTQIIPDQMKAGTIRQVLIIGRPEKTYGNSMGDHTTAFAVHVQGLQAALEGATYAEAVRVLDDRVAAIEQLPGMQL